MYVCMLRTTLYCIYVREDEMRQVYSMGNRVVSYLRWLVLGTKVSAHA